MKIKFLSVIVGCALLVSCATFRHNAIPVTDVITTKLESLSTAADELTTLRIMTSAQRQNFAREVMIPAIQANKSFAQCLLDGTCQTFPTQLKTLSTSLLKGITDYVPSLPSVPSVASFKNMLDDALHYVTGLVK